MPIGSIIVLILMVAALITIYVVWSRGNRQPATTKGTSGRKSPKSRSSSRNHNQPAAQQDPSPEPTPEPPASIPDLSFTTLEKERDSDPEITMMGKVPDELLAIMQGELHARHPPLRRKRRKNSISTSRSWSTRPPKREITGKHAPHPRHRRGEKRSRPAASLQ